MIAATMNNDISTIRIHDDYCKNALNDTSELSDIVSESYKRRRRNTNSSISANMKLPQA